MQYMKPIYFQEAVTVGQRWLTPQIKVITIIAIEGKLAICRKDNIICGINLKDFDKNYYLMNQDRANEMSIA